MRLLTALLVALTVVALLGCGPKPKTGAPGRPEAQLPVESKQLEAPETTATAATQPAEALPKLWDFAADWCPPCREQAPIVHELEKEYDGKVEFRIIDVDKEQDLARKFGVQAIPTQVFLSPADSELSRHVGLFPKDSIVNRFKAHGVIK